jgi:prolyl-tRNA synthetase
MGALIMTHSDDFGLVLPPKLAPIQVVIVPIYKSTEDLNRISNYAEGLISELRDLGISVKYDDDDQRRAGWKFAEYEMKGVPIRIAIGPKDMENGTVELSRRDVPGKEGKEYAPQTNLAERLQELLDEIQVNLFQRASSYRQEMTTTVDNYDDFKKTLTEKGGFILAHWDGSEETEKRIKEETKATIRCILHGGDEENGKCIYSGKPSKRRVVFAKAY